MDYRLEFLHFGSRQGNVVLLHQHQCYELVYYFSGSGTTTINGTTYKYYENSFRINSPRIPHSEIHEQKTDKIFIGFNMPADLITFRSDVYTGQIASIVSALLIKMKDEMLDKKPFFALRLKSLLIELIVSIGRVHATPTTEYVDLSYIKNFLSENYAQNIDYKNLSTVSGYSYHRFRHIFKDLFGTPPHQYVQQLRLKNACEMLLQTEYPISRIALENGFSNESHFCNLFRREFGETPTTFRNKTDF